MLSEPEQLQLQQLRLLDSAAKRDNAAEEPAIATQELAEVTSPPSSWSLTGDLHLREWQEQALSAWFHTNGRGVAKVVTGAGKTVLALAIAERLQERDPELRVAVVVPTIVLMQQWYDTIRRHSNLPPHAVGRLGGGHRDDLTGERRILIAVLASARKELPALVRRAGVGEHLLLVVDESHRAGAPEMSQVLATPRAYTLGLSATPERSEGEFGKEESEVLTHELGEIVFELTYADAIRQGILPPFEIFHFGLPLNEAEAQQYAALTRSISDTRRELTAVSPTARKARGRDGLLQWARRVAARPGDLSALAFRYVNDTTRRKQLLYRAESRAEAALALVREALTEQTDARVILFHESIDEVAALFERMVRSQIPVVMEHSELPPELRERSLGLFRLGTAQVIVSARSLIEGFDVPEADLGIVVASSTSARQRIQSIGRVLRKHRDAEGEQKSSRVCVLYIRETVDEAIYEKEDWERLIGLERNRYFTWDPPQEPLEQPDPPRSAIPREADIDLAALNAGEVYPGRYQGAEYTADGHANVVDADRRVALNPQDVPAAVIAVRGRPGRFRVTPMRGAILVRTQEESGDWATRFVGLLEEPFAFAEELAGDAAPADEVDVRDLAPGDPYLGPLIPADELRFRQRAGGVIARKVRGGELSARGADAERLVEVLRRLSHTNAPVTRFNVNSLGHAFWREAGSARFIAVLEHPLEFPETAT